MIPEQLLSVLDENELELIICGSSHISVEDLKLNCIIPDDHTEIEKKVCHLIPN